MSTNSINEIFFKPALQVENTGDLLINKAQIDLMRKYGTVILDDNHRPTWFMNELSPDGKDIFMTTISNESLYKTIFKRLKDKEHKSKNIYLVMPGGNTSRKGRKVAISTFKNFIRLLGLKLAGCKIVRTGFSIGPFDRFNGKVESLNSRAFHHYSFRDQSSLSLAKKLKFKNPMYSPDLAWAYQPSSTSHENAEDYYVISLRSNSYGEVHNTAYLSPIKKSLVELLKNVIPINSRIILAYQVLYDRDACAEIYNDFKAVFPHIEFLDKKLLLTDAEHLYAGAKCVISNRLHVLLLAMQCKSLPLPFVIDVDNKKVTSIYNDNGLSSCVIHSDGNIEKESEKFRYALHNKQFIMSQFDLLVEKNQKLIDETFDLIFSDHR